jgi:acyl-CoA reductase-like NAD-dependent aldehyde dehydrogenase
MPSGNLGVRFYMWAKDEEHAVKIANERRAALVAANVWTTNYDAWERLTNEWKELDGGKV